MSDQKTQEAGASRREILGAGRWLELYRIYFEDPSGRHRTWELASRSSGAQAVAIIAKIEPERQWILVRQYRPPAQGYVVEFPAGLMDPGERPDEAAIREFAEETGYRLQVEQVFPPVYNSPGLTDESVWIVVGKVDSNDPQNRTPCPRPEPGELIEVFTVSELELPAQVMKWMETGQRVDAKVLAFALGIQACRRTLGQATEGQNQ